MIPRSWLFIPGDGDRKPARAAGAAAIDPPFFVQSLSGIPGGNARVGPENNLFHGGRVGLAPSNGAQVARIRHIPRDLPLKIATSGEARHRLGTKGAANTGV